MKLSTKGRYGLRALIDLALYSETEPVSINTIAERQGLSEGYSLAKPASEISVGDILRALEGNLEPVDCGGLNPEEGCSASGTCVTKYVWQRINESITNTVDEIMLDQILAESRKMPEQPSGSGRNCKG